MYKRQINEKISYCSDCSIYCHSLHFFQIGNDSEKEEIKMTISKPGLDVLLDGLHKIQNQLSNVANKTSHKN